MASTLNGKVIVKVLIDKEKYLHFLKCQKFYDEHNEKLKKELKLPKGEEGEPKQDSQIEGKQETEPQSSQQQIGTGVPDAAKATTNTSNNEHFNFQISAILRNLETLGNSLKCLINPSSSQTEQQGSGEESFVRPELPVISEQAAQNVKKDDESLLPPLVNLVPSISTISRPGEEIEYHKGKNFDQFDVQSLIAKIPNRYQQRAANLLKAISISHEIDFDKSGNIFVRGTAISNAKIDQIFPALFSNLRKTSNIPGLRDFIIALANNNLGHYVVAKRFVTGMKRPRNYVFRPDTEPMFKKFKNWWYLGN